jgi:hypothetical protein
MLSKLLKAIEECLARSYITVNSYTFWHILAWIRVGEELRNI